jgi:membrane protease YdiL (CAAX protease family)
MRTGSVERPTTARILAAVIVVAAAAGLVLRPGLLATQPFSSSERIWLLTIFYCAVLVSSALAASPGERAVLHRGVVLAIGLGALGLAWASAGPTAPLAVTPITLGVSLLAAVAEEACFRGVAYSELRRFGVGVAIVLPALLFAIVHVPSYGLAALPVDLGAGLLLGWQRWASGSWAVPAATHVGANLLAAIR